MLRNSLVFVALSLSLSFSSAPRPQQSAGNPSARPRAVGDLPVRRALPAPEKVFYGGVIDAATGERSATALLGPTELVLYDNSCDTGFFAGMSPGEAFVDGGRIPSLSSPTGPTVNSGESLTGTANAYQITSIQVGFVTVSPTTTQTRVGLIELWGTCDTPVPATLWEDTFDLPEDVNGGLGTAWLVDIDLSTLPEPVVIAADGDGFFDDDPLLDGFGFLFELADPAPGGSFGPFLRGDPGTCPFGAGTAFSPSPGPGTGLGQADAFYLLQNGVEAGCFFFGGWPTNPWSGYHLIVRGQPFDPCAVLADPPVASATTSDPQGVALGDVDGDGLPDLVTADPVTDTLSVRLGDGTGAFSGGSDTAIADLSGLVQLGDVNNDGLLDIVTTSVGAGACGVDDRVHTGLNQGGGTFSFSSHAPGFTASPDAIRLEERRGTGASVMDSTLDLYVVSAEAGTGSCPAASFSVLTGNGDGTFGPPLDLHSQSSHTLEIVDLERDGRPDVVVAADTGSGPAVVFYHGVMGGGYSENAVHVASGPLAGPIGVGDVNGDRVPDVVAFPDNGGIFLEVLESTCCGHAWNVTTSPVPAVEPRDVELVDLDLDGDADLVTVDVLDQVNVFLNDGAGVFTPCPPLSGSGLQGLSRGDVDGDGDLDVATSSTGGASTYLDTLDPANAWSGIHFPGGAASFADTASVFMAGAGTAPPFDDPSAAVGPPDAEIPGSRAFSLGDGGVLEVGFTDNVVTNSGDSAPDLVYLDAGGAPEYCLLAFQAANPSTYTALTNDGHPEIFTDGGGWFLSLTCSGSINTYVDIDECFPGFGLGQLRFNGIRFIDNVHGTGPSNGADIDAVGALTTAQAFPNLQVPSVGVPPNGVGGQQVAVSWTVENVGEIQASGTWTDRVILSTDTVLGNGDDVDIAGFASPAPLLVGESYFRSLAITLPNQTQTWYVAVVADDAGVVAESIEDDNTGFSAATISVQEDFFADLVVTSVTAPPGPVVSGTPILVSFTVQNAGLDNTTSPSWNDYVYINTSNAGNPAAGGTFIGSLANLTALAPAETYVRSVSLNLPNDISGDYYVGVVTDGNNNETESDDGNNYAFTPATFTVDLEPQPDLVPLGVGTLTGTAFAGQLVDVSWTDLNQGDGITDTSSWSDQVWLSLDSNLSVTAGDVLLGSLSTPGFLVPAQSHALNLQALVPVDLAGDFWIKVVADASNQISEVGGEGNNVAVSASMLTVVPSVTPDLRADSVGLAAEGSNLLVGHTFDATWSVVDEGFADWDTGFSWVDGVYLSTDPVYDAGIDVQLGAASQSASFVGGQWVGSTYSKTRTFRVPVSTVPGTYYLVMVTDLHDTVYEINGEGNNEVASGPLTVDLIPTDLVITVGAGGTFPPASAAAGQSIGLHWTVDNTGLAVTPVGSWTDRVYLSTDALLGAGDISVASVGHTPALPPGGSYTVSTSANVPLVGGGSYFLLFQTDSGNNVFESGGEGNNLASFPFTVTGDTSDLVPSALVVPKSVNANEPLGIQWTITNEGTLPTNDNVWFDNVYLSLDTFLDGSDVNLGSVVDNAPLAPAESRPRAANFTVPQTMSGLWWVLVVCDSSNRVFESNEGNNLIAARMRLDITPLPDADLNVVSVSTAASVDSGQPLQVDWVVRNDGLGATNYDDWPDSVYLSPDPFLDLGSDMHLGYAQHSGFLAPAEERNMSRSFIVPQGVSGLFFTIVRTNSNNRVREISTADNVTADTDLVDVSLAPPSNLVVSDVQIPAAVQIGDPFLMDWTTSNVGVNSANGAWKDTIFLSLDGVLEATDTLVGEFPSTAGTIGPAGMHVQATSDAGPAPPVPGVLPGNYTVFVRTDVLNQIRETDDTDNVGSSLGTVSVAAPTLAVGTSVVATLAQSQPLYYEIISPPNETVLVELDHSSMGAWTELYIREGGVPSTGLYDLRFDAPGSSTQAILIPSTGTEPIFLLARATNNVVTTDATLTATIVPFGVTAVAPGTVGAGIVTCEILGSQMDEAADVRLRHVGTSQEITAHELALVDASLLLAAFDLTGAPLGDYDVIATALDSSTAQLLSAVTVEPPAPLAAGLTVRLPASVRKGRHDRATVVIRNEGNVNLTHGLLAFGTLANEGAAAPEERVDVTSSELGLVELDSNGTGESLVLLVEDLGPSQTCESVLQVAVGDSYPSDVVTLGLSGRPAGAVEFMVDFQGSVASFLRSAVLADPESGAALLALAGNAAAWNAAVGSGLGPDTTDVHLPSDLPELGAAFVGRVAAAAAAGLPPGNAVGQAAIDAVRAELACLVFAGESFVCDDLFPPVCQDGLSEETVLAVEGSNLPVGVLCGATPTSDDPNEKNAAPGFGPQNQLSSEGELPYVVFFENQSSAAASASRVELRDALDPGLRASSFRLGDMQFGQHTVNVPPGTISFQTQLDLIAEMGLLLNITAGVDALNHEAFWIFQSIDPATGLPPADDRGFLPPNNENGDGEGSVAFSSSTNGPSVGTGTVIANSANIGFDVNAPLATNEVSNELDADAPTSSMASGSGLGSSTNIILTWSGSDPPGGSGVKSYTTYVSTDAGPFVPWLVDTTLTSGVFPGQAGHTYAFYSRAKDNTGNVEPAPPAGSPDVVVSLGQDCNDNGIPDDEDLTNGTSQDCNANGVPDECDIADGSAEDCNGSGVPDECELAGNDCDANGVPDECDPDCNGNGTPDECETFPDCNGNGVPDECELGANDCDGNGVPDECDPDCNSNGTPDACESFADCNGSGVPDECELAGNDCDANGVPDECDEDCNSNGTPDACESFADCNGSGVPDECELAGNDCDANGVPDECDEDCNANGTPDACESFADCNGSGVPDECELSGNDCDANGVPDECDEDCNSNGTPDACESFADCNGSGVPDECELAGNDCDANGVPDECDPDCDSTGVPDACETFPDCNGNGVPDDCDVAGGDCNSNGIPDDCDAAGNDCNSNGIPDDCELLADCNVNGVPDACDIASGAVDANANGIPDECECNTFGYCTPATNSNGVAALMGHQGSLFISNNDFVLICRTGLRDTYSLFVYSATRAYVPIGDGFLCLGGQIFRLAPVITNQFGGAVLPVDFNAWPMNGGPGMITPGSTWNFQLWYRDPENMMTGSNLSNGMAATFCP